MPKRNINPSPAADPDSVIKLLISTDNHLGYLEKDPVRGDDSFRAFEEVLELAKANAVDMLLLGGDLFHDNKPSRATLVRTMQILRKACLSPGGSIRLAVRSDPAQVNYMDPTIAVSLPVFVIHGNHDDPTGALSLSALDLLAQAGLVTYFGKMPNAKRLDIKPILLQKGATALALYGLGNIRDEVLYHTWAKDRNVKWLSPMNSGENRQSSTRQQSSSATPATENPDGSETPWFNLLVLHQNRVTRGISKGISDNLLPRWLDYVVWGHEHDSIPDLTHTSPPVVQPGSTVPTSLSVGESKPKHAILLEVFRGRLKHRTVELKTTRQFRFHDVALSDQTEISDTDPSSVVSFLEDTVSGIATKLEAEFDKTISSLQDKSFPDVNSDGVRYPPANFYIEKLTPSVRQPLIRLRVEISGNWEVPNPQRFGQTFLGRVASAADVLLFYRSRKSLKKTRAFMYGYSGQSGVANEDGEFDEDEDGNMLSQNGAEQRDVVQIPKLVQYFLYHSKAGGAGLKFLELDKLTGVVDDFVTKNETRAIIDYVNSYLKVQQDKTMKEASKDDDGMLDEEKLKEKFEAGANEAMQRVLKEIADKKAELDSKTREGKERAKTADEEKKVADEGGEKRRSSRFDSEQIVNASDGEGSQNDDLGNRNADGNSKVDDVLGDVHAVLVANPKLAAAIQKTKTLKDSDEESEETGAPSKGRAASGTGRSRGSGRGRGRGKGRGKGRAASPSATVRKSKGGASKGGASGSTRSRRVTRQSESVMEVSDDEEVAVDVGDEIEAVEASDEEEYIPVSSTRKRRAQGTANRGRSSQRARLEASGSGGGSGTARRSVFATRARARRSTSTIDVGEESGDDAM